MPASSAAAERNWSAFSFVHSRLRNRLTPDKVEKLVYIFFNKKLQYKEDFDDSYFYVGYSPSPLIKNNIAT